MSARGFILRAVAAYGLPIPSASRSGAKRPTEASSTRWRRSCGAVVVERLGPPLVEPLFEELAIVGVGLIGSSIARAARRRNAARRIVLADQFARRVGAREGSRARRHRDGRPGPGGQRRGLRHSLRPRRANEAIGRAIGPSLRPGTIVSDVGSVKGAVISTLNPILPAHVRLVPAHPVAGTEQSGPDAGFATLFINRWCILTPPERTDEEAVRKVRLFWEALGSHVQVMTPAHHDLVLAITSHVPHLIAYNIVGTAADLEEVTQSEVINSRVAAFAISPASRLRTRPCGATFSSATRTLWLEMLGRFNEDLTALQRMIRVGTARDCRRCSPARGRSVSELSPKGRRPRRLISAGARRRRTRRFREEGPGARARAGRRLVGFRLRVADVAARIRVYAPLQGDVARLAKIPLRLFARDRGSPERPGLVLGLDRGGACPGVAFHIESARREATIRYLRQREQATAVYLERSRRLHLNGASARLP